MTLAETVAVVILGSSVIFAITVGPKFYKLVEMGFGRRHDAIIQVRRCIYCGDLLPFGRYSFCDKQECISQFADIYIEKNRVVFDRLGEL